MYNDTISLDMTIFYPLIQTESKEISKNFDTFLDTFLEDIKRKSIPKDTSHLDLLIEKHEKAVSSLESALLNENQTFFYDMHQFLKMDKDLKWTLTKFHLEKMKTLFLEKKHNEIKKIIYACSYQSYLFSLSLNSDSSDIFNGQIAILIDTHKKMIRDIDKVKKDVRLRALLQVKNG